jgi:two-component system response regulator
VSRPVILLVEDDPEDVRFFKRAAEKAGLDCRLVVAEDGQIAVDRLSSREDGPTHVLLDLKLPRKSGLEVLEWIRSHSTLGKTPVIVLTSSEVQSDLQRAHGLGVDAYLVKPLTSAELEGVVRRIADRWNIGPGAPD